MLRKRHSEHSMTPNNTPAMTTTVNNTTNNNKGCGMKKYGGIGRLRSRSLLNLQGGRSSLQHPPHFSSTTTNSSLSILPTIIRNESYAASNNNSCHTRTICNCCQNFKFISITIMKRIIKSCSMIITTILIPRILQLHTTAIHKSYTYKYIYQLFQPIIYKAYIILHLVTCDILKLVQLVIHEVILPLTKYQLALLLFVSMSYYSCYMYYIELPIYQYNNEWLAWETAMQLSVTNLIPPSPSVTQRQKQHHPPQIQQEEEQLHHQQQLERLFTKEQLNQTYPSVYNVPIPNYELMERTRNVLADRLHDSSVQSCIDYHHSNNHPRQNEEEKENEQTATTPIPSMSTSNYHHTLPVLGITVANDTPTNQYLRRLLHTIDLNIVGSTIITWYDEHTEYQFVNSIYSRSHIVIDNAIQEYLEVKKFVKIASYYGNEEETEEEEEYDNIDNSNNNNNNYPASSSSSSSIPLSDVTSLKLMSETTLSIQQYCIIDEKAGACMNELVILHFPTNLGCSLGANNALFLHPTAPHWLIANYDIAYPPDILNNMGLELHRARKYNVKLAVHTYGYIYGRGKIENPWSNFVITNCAVSKVGVWDENIFPAYYEDDDYRDRIRYILATWYEIINPPTTTTANYDNINNDGQEKKKVDSYYYTNNAPQKYINDTYLIRYMTNRNVSVVHGPINANTYLSGTHETMKQAQEEEEIKKQFMHRLIDEEESFITRLWLLLTHGWWQTNEDDDDDDESKMRRHSETNTLHYESLRWSLLKDVADAEAYFRCKHGALPDAGEHGDDPLRYFGWYERNLVPFVNQTRGMQLREYFKTNHQNETTIIGGVNRMKDYYATDDVVLESRSNTGIESTLSPWATWTFNATRRRCVHDAVNVLLSMPPSEERTVLTNIFKTLCSVC